MKLKSCWFKSDRKLDRAQSPNFITRFLLVDTGERLSLCLLLKFGLKVVKQQSVKEVQTKEILRKFRNCFFITWNVGNFWLKCFPARIQSVCHMTMIFDETFMLSDRKPHFLSELSNFLPQTCQMGIQICSVIKQGSRFVFTSSIFWMDFFEMIL